jgi:hypothetical protein
MESIIINISGKKTSSHDNVFVNKSFFIPSTKVKTVASFMPIFITTFMI